MVGMGFDNSTFDLHFKEVSSVEECTKASCSIAEVASFGVKE
jgi:hypothetical protein